MAGLLCSAWGGLSQLSPAAAAAPQPRTCQRSRPTGTPQSLRFPRRASGSAVFVRAWKDGQRSALAPTEVLWASRAAPPPSSRCHLNLIP